MHSRALLVAVALCFSACHSLPAGKPGEAAAALGHRIGQAVNVDAWSRTGVVSWAFPGGHEHLWDRRRGFDRVRWGHTEVLVDLGHKTGRAWDKGAEVSGDRRARLVERAWAYWANDSFWLNPLAKLFDDGVIRELALVDGQPALIVKYMSGGVTPGDRYLWLLGADCLPRAWRLWVKIIPIPGLEFSWKGWTTLATGALVATEHSTLGIRAVRLSGILAAPSLEALVGDVDPFAPLLSPSAVTP